MDRNPNCAGANPFGNLLARKSCSPLKSTRSNRPPKNPAETEGTTIIIEKIGTDSNDDLSCDAKSRMFQITNGTLKRIIDDDCKVGILGANKSAGIIVYVARNMPERM